MSVSYIPKWGWSHGRADRIDRYTTEYVYQVPARRRRAFGERLCQRGNFQFYDIYVFKIWSHNYFYLSDS